MNTDTTLGSAAVVAVALAVAFGMGVGAVAATDPTVDSSTTDASTHTSELDSDVTVSYNASEDYKVETIFKNNSKDDLGVEIRANDTKAVVASNFSLVDNGHTGSEGTHYNATFTGSEFADLEHALDENVTAELGVFNTSNTSNASTVTFHVNFSGTNTTVQYVDDSDVDAEDIVTVTNESGILGTSIGGEENAEVETDDRNISGDGTTEVVLALGNTSVQDQFDVSAEDASSGDKLHSLGLDRTAVLVQSDDDETLVAVPVFEESAPDDFDTDKTYATYEEVGGTTSLVVHVGDEFDDSDAVTVHAIGNAGLTTFADEYLTGSSLIGAVGGFGLSLTVAVPLAVSTRRRRDVEEVLELEDDSDDEESTEPETTVSPPSPGEDDADDAEEAEA